MKRSCAVAVAALLLVPAPAAADGGAFRDGDEQPFCEDPGDPCPDTDFMDFRRVTFGHGKTRRVLRHGIRTRERWRTRVLGGRHGVTIYFDFNTDDDGRVERVLKVRRKQGELRARMYTGKYHRKRVAGPVSVWRPDRRTLKVAFPRRLLGDDDRRYRWSVSWFERGIGCPGSCHNDHAPDRGWYEHG